VGKTLKLPEKNAVSKGIFGIFSGF